MKANLYVFYFVMTFSEEICWKPSPIKANGIFIMLSNTVAFYDGKLHHQEHAVSAPKRKDIACYKSDVFIWQERSMKKIKAVYQRNV